MGCSSSSNTAVKPLRPEEVDGDEDEKGSKVDGRGDSAVSKGTTDSGVVMENREIPVLPGAVPRKLPALTCVGESDLDRVTKDDVRPKSSDILEELLNQGIIPVGQTSERGNGAGEAYSIMLDDNDRARRRPPARLESLKVKKVENLPSKEEIDEKIRLAEERRKSREDELKLRLRSKSARVRGPAPASITEGDETLTPVEPLRSPLTPETQDPPPHSHIEREEAEGAERVREAASNDTECREEEGADGRGERGDGGEGRDSRGGDEQRANEEGVKEEEDELTQVEELRKDQFFAASGELENDSSFQRAEDKEEVF